MRAAVLLGAGPNAPAPMIRHCRPPFVGLNTHALPWKYDGRPAQ